MCIACSALFRYILKEVTVCFSSSVYATKNCQKLGFSNQNFQPFSVQSLQEGVLGAGIAQLVVLGLAVHSVAGSILLWGLFR